jgi:hypothetical protein
MKKNQNNSYINVRINTSIKAELERLAEKENMDLPDFVREQWTNLVTKRTEDDVAVLPSIKKDVEEHNVYESLSEERAECDFIVFSDGSFNLTLKRNDLPVKWNFYKEIINDVCFLYTGTKR